MVTNLSCSLQDLLGTEYLDGVCRARAALTGEPEAALRRIASEKVDFYPAEFAARQEALMQQIGQVLCPPAPQSVQTLHGAPTDAFRSAQHQSFAPMSGLGCFRIGEDGSVADFVMNDKCAAGTGRFLEAMARTLETDVGSLAEIAKKATEKVEISSMCTVFAESEVISLIAQNKEKADIADGVHRAIAKKAVSLLRRIGIRPKVCMTGGVALNSGVVQAVEELIGQKVTVFSDPEIVGAAGAALYALEDIL